MYLFSEPQRHVRQPLSSRDPGTTAQVAPRQEAEAPVTAETPVVGVRARTVDGNPCCCAISKGDAYAAERSIDAACVRQSSSPAFPQWAASPRFWTSPVRLSLLAPTLPAHARSSAVPRRLFLEHSKTAIQRVIVPQDQAPNNRGQIVAKHTALSNLDQDPLNYLLQSWDEVRRISDAGADLDRFSDVHILSAKYHLIGEEHSLQANADFLKAVQDWGWGAMHLSEQFQTSSVLPMYQQNQQPHPGLDNTIAIDLMSAGMFANVLNRFVSEGHERLEDKPSSWNLGMSWPEWKTFAVGYDKAVRNLYAYQRQRQQQTPQRVTALLEKFPGEPGEENLFITTNEDFATLLRYVDFRGEPERPQEEAKRAHALILETIDALEDINLTAQTDRVPPQRLEQMRRLGRGDVFGLSAFSKGDVEMGSPEWGSGAWGDVGSL